MSDQPKRLSLSDQLRMRHDEMMAQASRPSRLPESIELGRSARGEVTIATKFYARDEETDDTFLERASSQFDRLRSRYPMSNGHVGATNVDG